MRVVQAADRPSAAPARGLGTLARGVRGDAIATRRPRRHYGPPAGTALPVVLLALALALWFVGLHRIAPAELSGWGLVTALRWPTLLSYPLLVAAMLASIAHGRCRGGVRWLVTAAGLLMVYGLQPATEGAARLPVAWLHAGFTNYIAATGAVLPNFDARFSWPGFFALLAFVGRAAGTTDVTALLNWAPVAMTGIETLAMLALARGILGSGRVAWLATWAFLLGDWTEEDYFSPQACAEVLLLVALAVTVHYLVRPGIVTSGRAPWKNRPRPDQPPGRRVAAQFVVLLLAAALAPTHQLTPFVLVAELAVLALWGRLWPRWMPTLALVPAVVWFVLGARQFWLGHIGWITSSLGDVNASVTSGVTNRVSGAASHQVVVDTRIALTLFVTGLALAGWLVERHRGNRTWTLPALAAAPFGLAAAQPYGGEIFVRIYLFAMPWFAVGVGLALDALLSARGRLRAVPRVAAGALLLAVIATTVFARGGNDAYMMITPADVQGLHYVYAHARPGQSVIAVLWYSPLRAARVGDLTQLSTGNLATANRPCGTPAQIVSCLEADRPQWILANPQQEAAGVLLSGFPPHWLAGVEAALEGDGYRVVFAEHGSVVLHPAGGVA